MLTGDSEEVVFYKNIFSEEMTFNLRFWYSKSCNNASVEKLFQIEGTENANTQKIA